MRQYTAESDGGADQRVEFFIATDGELQMARRDTLDFEILGRIASKFKDFGCKVLEDCSYVYSGWCGQG